MTLFRALGAVALATAVLTAPAYAGPCSGGFSESFRLKGQVETPTTYTLSALKKLPATRVTVTYFSGSEGLVTKSYVGASLYDLLNAAVVKTDPAFKNDILRKYVQVRASDCYESIIAVAELLPNFGGQQVLVAYADGDGKPLAEDEGMARLVVAGDKQGGRLVSNVKTIFVKSPETKGD